MIQSSFLVTGMFLDERLPWTENEDQRYAKKKLTTWHPMSVSFYFHGNNKNDERSQVMFWCFFLPNRWLAITNLAGNGDSPTQEKSSIMLSSVLEKRSVATEIIEQKPNR